MPAPRRRSPSTRSPGRRDGDPRAGRRPPLRVPPARKRRGQPAPDGMQLPLGGRSLKPSQQAAVGRAGAAYAASAGGRATPESPDAQQRVPVRAVPDEPRDVDRRHEPDLARAHARGGIHEALSTGDGGPVHARRGIRRVDVASPPSQLTSMPTKRVPWTQALPSAHRLGRHRLPDVDDGAAPEMRRRHELACHEASSRGPRRRGGGRSVGAGPTILRGRSAYSIEDLQRDDLSRSRGTSASPAGRGSHAVLGDRRRSPTRAASTASKGLLLRHAGRHDTVKPRPCGGRRGSWTITAAGTGPPESTGGALP